MRIGLSPPCFRNRHPVVGLGPLAAVDSADRAAREEHIARAKASSRACRALNLAKKEGQVGTRYGLRRVFEQERRPFMLAIKELRPPLRRPPALEVIGARAGRCARSVAGERNAMA